MTVIKSDIDTNYGRDEQIMREGGARRDVLEFYKKMQFNINENPEAAAMMIREDNNVKYIYPMEDDLYFVQDVLEIGCGAGWLSNSLAYWYNLDVTAIDYNQDAIALAKKTSELLGTNVKFEVADLFQYQSTPKDMVISNGVLHHTDNMRECESV